MTRKILHLDLDAFYPSVEVLDNPELAGKPVIVGGLGPRGVVASASYEARRHDVHSALPMAIARRRCPDAVFLRPRFPRYREISRRIFEIYRSWTPLVEPLSMDEAYLDVSERPEPGADIARRLRETIHEETGLTVSAGVAHNKFLAKLASDMDKPDGLTVIESSEAAAILAPLPVDKLWGVGPSTAESLRRAGLERIGQVAETSEAELVRLLGKNGRRLSRLSRGVDDRDVSPPGDPKSISAETTFDRDLPDWHSAGPHVRRFAERVAEGLQRRHLWARTVTLKVRYGDFTTITRSETPGRPLQSAEEILDVARDLARRVPLGEGRAMRLVGLGVSNIGELEELRREAGIGDARQLGLFDEGGAALGRLRDDPEPGS